jgi:hypothetical protein
MRDNIIPFPGQEPSGALVLRVELILVPDPVWRRLRVDDRATFWDLHAAIQDAMGWSHRHRHLFTVDHPLTGERLRLGIPEHESFYGRQAVLPSWQVKVADLARTDLPPFLYTHHLGEEWQHEVQLEQREAVGAAGPAPACLDGAGVCPPEGCGGAEAYARHLAGRPVDGPNARAFSRESVQFCDPRQLWQDIFGGD